MSLSESLFENLIKQTEEKAVKLKYLVSKSVKTTAAKGRAPIESAVVVKTPKPKLTYSSAIVIDVDAEPTEPTDPLDPLATTDLISDSIALVNAQKIKGRKTKANQKLFENSIKISASNLSTDELENIVLSAKRQKKSDIKAAPRNKANSLKTTSKSKVSPLTIKLGGLTNKFVSMNNKKDRKRGEKKVNYELLQLKSDSPATKTTNNTRRTSSSPGNRRQRSQTKSISYESDSSVEEIKSDSDSNFSPGHSPRRKKLKNVNKPKKNGISKTVSSARNAKNIKRALNNSYVKPLKVNVSRLSIDKISEVTKINKQVLQKTKTSRSRRIRRELKTLLPASSSTPKSNNSQRSSRSPQISKKNKRSIASPSGQKKQNTGSKPINKRRRLSQSPMPTSRVNNSRRSPRQSSSRQIRSSNRTNAYPNRSKVPSKESDVAIEIDPTHFEQPYLTEMFGKQFFKCRVKIPKIKSLDGNVSISDWEAFEEQKIQNRKIKRRSTLNKSVSFVETVEIFGESEVEESDSDDEFLVPRKTEKKNSAVESEKSSNPEDKEAHKEDQMDQTRTSECSDTCEETKINSDDKQNSKNEAEKKVVEIDEKGAAVEENGVITNEEQPEESAARLKQNSETKKNIVSETSITADNSDEEARRNEAEATIRKIRKKKYYSPLKSDECPRNKSLRVADEKICRPSITTLYGYDVIRPNKTEKQRKKEEERLKREQIKKDMKERKVKERQEKLEQKKREREEAKLRKKEEQAAEEFVVEKIEDKRTKDGVTEYYIKWAGYSAEENTWEPEDYVTDKDLIIEFEKSLKGTQSVTPESDEGPKNNDQEIDDTKSGTKNDVQPSEQKDVESDFDKLFQKTPTETSTKNTLDLNDSAAHKEKAENISTFHSLTEDNPQDEEMFKDTIESPDNSDTVQISKEKLDSQSLKNQDDNVEEQNSNENQVNENSLENSTEMRESVKTGTKHFEEMEDFPEELQENDECEENSNPDNEDSEEQNTDEVDHIGKDISTNNLQQAREGNTQVRETPKKHKHRTSSNEVDAQMSAVSPGEKRVDLESVSSDHSNDFEDTMDENSHNIETAQAIEAAIAAASNEPEGIADELTLDKHLDHSIAKKVVSINSNSTSSPVAKSLLAQDRSSNKTSIPKPQNNLMGGFTSFLNTFKK